MDTEFFKELERFSLLVKKRVSTAYSGGRKSLRFGHGISPVGYREYRKGDDFKLIDWKAKWHPHGKGQAKGSLVDGLGMAIHTCRGSWVVSSWNCRAVSRQKTACGTLVAIVIRLSCSEP